MDRVFTLAGHGTVVTGTAHAGLARAGDESADLRLMPAGERLRVRGIHAQNRPSETGAAGQRCALNLAGIDKNAIARGDWVADARCFLPSRHVDVELTLLPGGEADAAGAAGTVRAWTPLHVHIGAARHLAHAVPLSAETLAPGQSGWAQLVFDAPVCAMPGDRIVRNAQATRTVGGAACSIPCAGPQRRRAAAMARALAAMLDGADLAPLLEQAALGLDEAALQRLTGATRALAAPSGAQWLAGRTPQAPRTLILTTHWDAARQGRTGAGGFPSGCAGRARPDGARLRRMALPAMPDALWQVLLDDLQAQGRIARNGPGCICRDMPRRCPMMKPRWPARCCRCWPKAATIRPGATWRLRGEPEERVRLLLRKLLRRGEVAQVVKDLFYHRDRVRELATLARGLAAAPAGSTPRRSATRPAWGASARSRSWSSSTASATRGACATITCYAAKAPTRLASGGRAGIIGGPSRRHPCPAARPGFKPGWGVRRSQVGSTPAAFRHPSCARCRAALQARSMRVTTLTRSAFQSSSPRCHWRAAPPRSIR